MKRLKRSLPWRLFFSAVIGRSDGHDLRITSGGKPGPSQIHSILEQLDCLFNRYDLAQKRFTAYAVFKVFHTCPFCDSPVIGVNVTNNNDVLKLIGLHGPTDVLQEMVCLPTRFGSAASEIGTDDVHSSVRNLSIATR